MARKSANGARVAPGTVAGGASSSHVTDPAILDRKAKLLVERLSLGRDAIECVDVSGREGWAMVINEVLEAGFEPSDLEENFSASENTVYKWRQGMTAPRLLTRKLLKNAIVEMIDERIEEKSAAL